MGTAKVDSGRDGVKPFLRWAGGKTRIVNALRNRLPPNFSNGNRYHEPFLGGGSLFFRLRPPKATLSDRNRDLVECYRAVQERPDLVARYLKHHLSDNCEDYYYRMRDKYNHSGPSIAKSALFIYLNKTCFNGIWRVNKDGSFNVPYGHRQPKTSRLIRNMYDVSEALSEASIIHGDYRQVVRYARKGDIVYLDPPYPPLNGTSCFTQYTRGGFGKEEHAELASFASRLDQKGCFVMISNADIPYIRRLYQSYNIHELEVMRWIRADGKRYRVGEVIITNYDL